MKTHQALITLAFVASFAVVSQAEVILAASSSALTLTASYTALAVIAGLKLLAVKIAALAASDPAISSAISSTSFRKKRDVNTDVENTFSSIAAVDTYGCGFRLVCELEEKAEEELLEDEKLILSLFGLQPTIPAYLKLESSKSQYDFAAWLGASRVKTCKDMYNKCPLSSQQMLEEFRVAASAFQQ